MRSLFADSSEQSRKFVRFAIVGVSTAIIYFVLAKLLKPIFNNLQYASLVAFTIAVVFQFFMHRNFTFESQNEYLHDLPRFLAVVLVGYAVSTSTVLLAEKFALPDYIPLLAVVVVTPVLNWLGFSLWAFARKSS